MSEARYVIRQEGEDVKSSGSVADINEALDMAAAISRAHPDDTLSVVNVAVSGRYGLGATVARFEGGDEL